MAISGGAIIPTLYGRIIDARKIELIANGVQDSTTLAKAS
jgi:FHS family L-fucose permease-like MFS transporter